MSAAAEYHRMTNAPAGGTDEVVRIPGARPHPFKDYGEAEGRPIDASVAGRLLHEGAGIVRARADPAWPRPIYFRGYSSAGALYPVEAYVATSDGVFSFDALGPSLVRMRDGDWRAALAEAAAARQLAHAAAVVVLSGIPARTGWKYGERGYRHLWWDAGTMLANLLALSAAEDLGPRLYTGFVDRDVNTLLGLDGVHEYALALLAIGEAGETARGRLGPAARATSLLPADGARYPRAERLHEASSLPDQDAVTRWRAGAGRDEPALPRDQLVRAIRRRRSVREYSDASLPRVELAELLEWSEAAIPADAAPVVRQLVAVASVEGLTPGIYDGRLELIRSDDERELRRRVGFAAMAQAHPRLAAVNVFQLADLDAVVDSLGDRGYRWAQLEAGIRAGRLQIGAFMRGWGAAASTFFDAEVSRLLGTSESPMLMVAIGRRPRR